MVFVCTNMRLEECAAFNANEWFNVATHCPSVIVVATFDVSVSFG